MKKLLQVSLTMVLINAIVPVVMACTVQGTNYQNKQSIQLPEIKTHDLDIHPFYLFNDIK